MTPLKPIAVRSNAINMPPNQPLGAKGPSQNGTGQFRHPCKFSLQNKSLTTHLDTCRHLELSGQHFPGGVVFAEAAALYQRLQKGLGFGPSSTGLERQGKV